MIFYSRNSITVKKEIEMNLKPRDFSGFNRLKLERKPVGVKFLPTKPEGIERLKESRAMCEMFKEAQEGSPFYVQEEDFVCVEPMVLGMRDPEPALVSGAAGGSSGLFKEPRANRKLYQYIPKMPRGSVYYVAFSPIDQLTFDPDVMVITANVTQARILLRSDCYTSGDPWGCQGTPVLACAWMYVYPVVTGKMNFTITGLSMGMQAINMDYPEGLFLVSIPWTMFNTILENIQDDDIYHDFRAADRDAHFQRFEIRLEQLRKEIPAYRKK
jgi:uncharacterized protein (DUF169 family)